MENRAIEFLGEYRLSKKEYDHLHPDLQAGLVITAYAITEINTLMRLYLNTTHSTTNDQFIDSASMTMRNIMMRTLSAKVFEYYEMLRHKDTKNADRSWSDEAEKIRLQLKKTEADAGYRIAEFIRHEAANHYSLKAARKNYKHTSPRANFSLYVHRKTGNSFYPAGEEVMFLGRMSRHMDSIGETDYGKVTDDWMLWVRDAITIISNNYYQMIYRHIFSKKPDKYAKQIMHYIPFSMVQGPNRPTAPVIMRDETQSFR